MNRHIAADGHVVRLAIEDARGGWDVREQLDGRTVHLKHYDDWHRAERAMHMRELHLSRTGSLGLHATAPR